LAAARASARGVAVDAEHLPLRAFARQRQRDRAAAGAQIEHARGRRGEPLQRELDQQLGFWTWHQRAAVQGQLERPEFLPPDEIGQRLAVAPPRDQRA
jgi:hypothetical protein